MTGITKSGADGHVGMSFMRPTMSAVWPLKRLLLELLSIPTWRGGALTGALGHKRKLE